MTASRSLAAEPYPVLLAQRGTRPLLWSQELAPEEITVTPDVISVARSHELPAQFASASALESVGYQATRGELGHLLPGDPQFFGAPARGRGVTRREPARVTFKGKPVRGAQPARGAPAARGASAPRGYGKALVPRKPMPKRALSVACAQLVHDPPTAEEKRKWGIRGSMNYRARRAKLAAELGRTQAWVDRATRDKEEAENAHLAAARALGIAAATSITGGGVRSPSPKGEKEKGDAKAGPEDRAVMKKSNKGGDELKEHSPPRTLMRRRLNEPEQRFWCGAQLTFRRMMVMARAFWARHMWVPRGPVKDALFTKCRMGKDAFPSYKEFTDCVQQLCEVSAGNFTWTPVDGLDAEKVLRLGFSCRFYHVTAAGNKVSFLVSPDMLEGDRDLDQILPMSMVDLGFVVLSKQQDSSG